jgi:hypothetical protein
MNPQIPWNVSNPRSRDAIVRGRGGATFCRERIADLELFQMTFAALVPMHSGAIEFGQHAGIYA